MPVVQMVQHPKSLDARNVMRTVVLRDAKGLTWDQIAKKVWNISGARPTAKTCANAYYDAMDGKRRSTSHRNYANCGRKPEKLTEAVKKYLLSRLLALRKKGPCTAVSLQEDLAKARGVVLDVSKV